MGNVFGGSHKKKSDRHAPAPASSSAPSTTVQVSAQDRALLQVKVQRDRLHRLKTAMVGVIAREVEIARQMLRENKKQHALLALKRKRYQETLLERTEGQWANLSELAHSIEFARQQSAVFEALKQGNELLEQLNAQTKLEDVEALMEDTREAVAYQAEVSRMLGAELTHTDEADIEAQIANWEAELQVSDMPVAPTRAIAAPPAQAQEEVETPEVLAQPAAEAVASEEEEAEPAAAPSKAKVKVKQQQPREVVLAS